MQLALVSRRWFFSESSKKSKKTYLLGCPTQAAFNSEPQPLYDGIKSPWIQLQFVGGLGAAMESLRKY